MGSIDSLWIPTIAVSHIVGVLMWLYAVTRLAGPKSKRKAQQQSQGGPDEQPAAKHPSPYQNGHGDRAVELSQAIHEELDFDPETAVPVVGGTSPLPVELSWTLISYKVLQGKPGKGKKSKVKQILHPCTGRFRAGEAAALMGPSGAGKSTMMDILTGRKPSEGTGGTVRVNGHVLTPVIAGKYLSYVGQEDVFLPNLTAWESLNFYSWLSVPAALNRADRQAGMHKTLETMGLQEVKHSMVGGSMPGGVLVRGLSGGEKRRLSVACGLIGNPSLVFLDEPTTGLDSHAALSMVRHIVSLTRLGHTIACSIHQPRQEIFNAFDKVVILSEGHQVYIDPPGGCCQWFNGGLGYAYRPEEDGTVADWVITLVSIRFRDEDTAHNSR
ncbi:hypothetical protein WJX73_010230 [Symbiochloris irregularis]|uniref:ABC transporter domain-containing protein n=1 Tax=Symbiochloris irregularis TaxID=706552 RepID=A0AAW1NQI6_9CHLO